MSHRFRLTVPTAWLATSLVLSACSLLPTTTVAPGPPPADFEVDLERGPCFGSCPVYTLRVVGDGTVTYDGIRFVAAEGRQTTRLSPAEVEALARSIVEADFFQLDDSYEVQATDLPSITLTVTMNGQSKSVYHYGVGCGTELDTAPPELCEVEARIEAIAAANGWVVFP